MEKTGQVSEGLTPCCMCGRMGEAIYEGESYCFTHFMDAKYPAGKVSLSRQTTKLAEAHTKDI